MRSVKVKAAALAAFAFCAAGVSAADAPIRFMAYNVAYCRYLPEGETDVANTVSDPAVAAARINAEAPDFVALSEMSAGRTYGGVDQPARLGELTGMHHVFGEAFLSGAGGRYGVAILSREEPLSWWTVPLTNWMENAAGEWEKIGYEPRVLLVCEFKDFCVATSHFDTEASHRAHWLPAVLAELAKCVKPVFFMGDWNAKPGSSELAAIREPFTVISPVSGVRTYHGHSATGGSVIDYIAVDTAHAGDFHVARSYVVEDVGTSDHNPVMAEVHRRPAASELGWVDERFLTTGRTGTWSPSIEWNAGAWTSELVGDYAFAPVVPSGGNRVTMTVTAAFDVVPAETAAPDAAAQGAVWLGANGSFQVWTRKNAADAAAPSTTSANSPLESGGNGGMPAWLDVAAEGVAPQAGVDYTFRFVFDYRSKTYTVAVQYGAEWRSLAVTTGSTLPAGETAFPLAVQASCVSLVKFSGDGRLSALRGEWFSGRRGLALSIK